jgi:hypothetical protein
MNFFTATIAAFESKSATIAGVWLHYWIGGDPQGSPVMPGSPTGVVLTRDCALSRDIFEEIAFDELDQAFDADRGHEAVHRSTGDAREKQPPAPSARRERPKEEGLRRLARCRTPTPDRVKNELVSETPVRRAYVSIAQAFERT